MSVFCHTGETGCGTSSMIGGRVDGEVVRSALLNGRAVQARLVQEFTSEVTSGIPTFSN